MEFEWKLNVSLAIISLLGFEIEVVYDMIKERKNRNYNFSYSDYKVFLCNKVATTLFILNCISYTSKPFLDAKTYRNLLCFHLAFDCLLMSLMTIFAEEMALFITCPQFTQW